MTAPPHPALTTGDAVAARVRTPTAEYPILVQPGLLDCLGEILRELGLSGRAFVLTDAAIAPLLLDRATAALAAAGYGVESHAIAPGEEAKHLATVATVYDWLLGHRLERQDVVVCLGGGVVTDLGGFAAATALRGVEFVHVPTSLLAMVDAAVGGKTGVDHPRGKNLIGAFAQPRAVVIDPSLLETLPPRQLRAGWAEVIKHGLILDPALTAALESQSSKPDAAMRDPALIARSVAIKAEVVSGDEREAGRRSLLNYGHTIGHALEAVTGYSSLLHGDAVAIGMRAAGLIAVELGVLEAAAFARQQRLLAAYGLPDNAPGVDPTAVIQATLQDKKVQSGAVRWVLLRAIGDAYQHGPVDPAIVQRAVEAVVA